MNKIKVESFFFFIIGLTRLIVQIFVLVSYILSR